MNSSEYKLYKIPLRAWVVFLLLIQSTEILLALWLLFIQNWVYSSMGITSNLTFDILHFNGQIFEGSLTSCKSGCLGSYRSNMKDWCEFEKSSQMIPAKSACRLFSSLYFSSVLYIIFSSVSILMKILKTFSLISYTRNKYKWLGNFASKMSLIFCLFGFVQWSLINEVWISNECEVFPQYGDKISICPGFGYKFSLFVVGLTFLFEILFSCVINKMYKINEEVENRIGIRSPNLRFFKYFERLSVSTLIGINHRNDVRDTAMHNNQEIAEVQSHNNSENKFVSEAESHLEMNKNDGN